MKISQKTISLLAALAIILLLIGKSNLIHHYPDKSFGLNSYSYEPTALDSLNDSIRDATNKLDALKQEKEIFTKGFTSYSGFTFEHFGIVTLEFPSNHPDFKKEFLRLTSIGLKFDDIHDKTFLIYQLRDGQPHLITKRLIKDNEEDSVVNVFKKVDYKYSATENSIFLPIKSMFFRFLIYIICILISLIMLTAYLFLVFTFFKFLLAVAKNSAFEKANVQRLREMSVTLFAVALAPYIIDGIIYLIFILNHDSEGVIITRSFFEYDYYVLISAILCYLIYTAFKKAMILQQEQELTI